MAKIVAIANQKGGVGKTTTAVNLAASIAVAEKSVLLLDLDAQANASSGLGAFEVLPEHSSFALLYDNAPLQQVIIKQVVEPLEMLHLVPSSADLVAAEVEFATDEDRAQKLTQAFERNKNSIEDYDFVIIDCPPSLGILTVNALCAANSVLVPVQAEYYALEGISRLWETLEFVRNRFNQKLAIEGVLLTMADMRTTLAKQVDEELRNHFGNLVYNTTIPRSVRLAEAPSHGLPVILYEPLSSGALAYLNLAKEFLERNGIAV